MNKNEYLDLGTYITIYGIFLIKKEEKISLTNTIYILSLLIFYIKNDFIVNLKCFFLFQEKIPLNLFNEIKNISIKIIIFILCLI